MPSNNVNNNDNQEQQDANGENKENDAVGNNMEDNNDRSDSSDSSDSNDMNNNGRNENHNRLSFAQRRPRSPRERYAARVDMRTCNTQNLKVYPYLRVDMDDKSVSLTDIETDSQSESQLELEMDDIKKDEQCFTFDPIEEKLYKCQEKEEDTSEIEGEVNGDSDETIS